MWVFIKQEWSRSFYTIGDYSMTGVVIILFDSDIFVNPGGLKTPPRHVGSRAENKQYQFPPHTGRARHDPPKTPVIYGKREPILVMKIALLPEP